MYDLRSWLNDLQIDYIDYNLVWTAFTHRSYKGMVTNVEDNERLEYLGDAVLDLINSEILYHDDQLDESEMTELRKMYVSNEQLAVIFDELYMEQFVRVAKNLNLSNRMKASFFEAFFGAIFLEKGYSDCYNLWLLIQERISSIEPVIEDQSTRWIYPIDMTSGVLPLKNAKTTLQEFCQNRQFNPPSYKVIKRSGPEHNLIYTVKVTVTPGKNIIVFESVFEAYVIDKSSVSATGRGRRKKIAEMRAAQEMCDIIGLSYSTNY